MNNLKKIGLSALAGSLVAFSANAAEMSVAGSASLGVKNTSNATGKAWTMGNQLTFSGSGETDGGLNVSLSFVIDQGDDTAIGSGPFDSHSLTIGSDSMGTLVFSGEGGSSAQTAIDGTAAGDIWDNGLGISSPKASEAGNNSMLYTLPSLMDDLTLKASYSPSGAEKPNSAVAYSVSYAGIDGLTVDWATGESNTVGSEADTTTMKASYAINSFTVAVSNTEHDLSSGNDDEVTSYKVSYTVSDDLSISYGHETHETAGSTTDEEVEAITVSYTTGGMTLTAAQIEAEGVDHSATTTGDAERWKLSASFAF
jgi:outer membrane protein OmpU